MAWTIEDRFPNWGDDGESPPDGFQYDAGDQINEKHLDYFWNSIDELLNDFRTVLLDIDSDQDGVVDEADSANAYKGNDIDSDGDGVVDEADDAANATGTYKGNDIDSDGDGVVDEADSTNLYKGNDIDSNGDGTVDYAVNAQQFDGLAPSDGTDGQFIQTDGNVISWVDYNPVLSNLTIDSDKDWLSYDITNVGTVETSTTQTDNYIEGHYSQTVTSDPVPIDLTNGNVQRFTMQVDASFDFTNVTTGESNQVTLRIVQDATGGWDPTFNNVRWEDATEPTWSTSANAIDIVSFVYDPVDGIWDGFVGGINMQ